MKNVLWGLCLLLPLLLGACSDNDERGTFTPDNNTDNNANNNIGDNANNNIGDNANNNANNNIGDNANNNNANNNTGSDTGTPPGSDTGAPPPTDTSAPPSSDTNTPPPTDTGAANDGAPCGWQNQGKILNVSDSIELCIPPTICNLETCQSSLGTCASGKNGTCTYHDGYNGLKTLPEAWATWYCDLTDGGGCAGTIEAGATMDVRNAVSQYLGNVPWCYKDTSGTCLGIVAFSPLMGGNSRLAKDENGGPLRNWGLGLTPASGLCYEIEGMTGTKAIVAVTDRCAGYCDCGNGQEECGNCLLFSGDQPSSATPSCPCVGSVPSMGPGGQTCNTQQTCDWCMTNSHPHFDLDTATFNHICADKAVMGSCQIKRVKPVPCMAPATWPCPQGAWFCFEENAVGRIPGTWCCQ
ncbi:MAG: hypothetical protein GX146_12530 [Myxococcales bacterium]|nr:hypothetical protein [Myxococcales bacterium]